jgi:hypothetical protein
MSGIRRVETGQLAQVAELAERHGVWWHHCRDARHCHGKPGLPDLVLVGPGGVAFRELKSELRHMAPAQTEWKWALKAGGADVDIWLPSHFRSGAAEALFDRLGHPRFGGSRALPKFSSQIDPAAG